jgi:catalase
MAKRPEPGHVEAAQPLLDTACVEPDEGIMPLGSAKDISAFIEACRKLRLWARETKVKL